MPNKEKAPTSNQGGVISSLSISQLKNYLGTGLKIVFDNDEHEHEFVGFDITSDGLHLISPFGDFGRGSLDKCRPLMYRLSDLDKFIPELGFVPLEEINGGPFRLTKFMIFRHEFKNDTSLLFSTKVVGYNIKASFEIMQKLFSWHFWPFGEEYFEKGLVIDKLQSGC